MVRTFFVALCLSLFVTAQTQTWAPIGAEWFYTEVFFGSDEVDYLKITSEKDTLFNGIQCKKLVKRHDIWCNNRPPEFEITFSRNDTVFFWDPSLESFEILYDFTAEVGDSWVIRIKDVMNPADMDSVVVSVDGLSTIEINGIQLKKRNVTYTCFYESAFGMNYPSVIVESIGDMTYLFNFFPEFGLACDMNWSQGLRCYSDSVIGFYSTGIADSCNYVSVGINEREDVDELVSVYPNPFSSVIYFDLSKMDPGLVRLEIFTVKGILLHQMETKERVLSIPFSDKAPGVYFCRITSENGTYTRRLLLQ